MMQKLSFSFILLLIFITVSSQKELSFGNINYKKSILSSYYQNPNSRENIPILSLGGSQQLILHFDEAADGPINYNYKIIHCEEDWTASDLFETEFIEGMNEGLITDFKYSKNTDIDYIHYQFAFPNNEMKIKRSGNYTVLIYEDFDQNKIVFTKQFYVVESLVKINLEVSLANQTDLRKSHHQFQGEADISHLNCLNPNQELSFRLVKNNDYRKDFIHLKANYQNNNKLQFNGFLNTIPAGNEFRIFDIRQFNQGTPQIHKIIRHNNILNTILVPNKIRNLQYNRYPDHNGRMFVIGEHWQAENYEKNYSMVHFYLNCDTPLVDGDVYIFGELTGWEYLPEAKLKYSSKSKQYVGKLLLKQGLYDYAYIFVPNNQLKVDWGSIEGNFSDTSNEYLLLVYYKPPNNNYQKLVGIQRLNYFE